MYFEIKTLFMITIGPKFNKPQTLWRHALFTVLHCGIIWGKLRFLHGQKSDDARGIFKKAHFNILIYRPQILFIHLSLSLSLFLNVFLPFPYWMFSIPYHEVQFRLSILSVVAGAIPFRVLNSLRLLNTLFHTKSVSYFYHTIFYPLKDEYI